MRPHRPDVVIINLCVHVVVLVGLHAIMFELTDAGRQMCCVLAMRPMLYSLATTCTEVKRPKQRSELTDHELRPCTVATGSCVKLSLTRFITCKHDLSTN
jgi:hypothetical protein